ncbi:MAG: ABC transporter ATP-binding protein/permease [Alcaligenaceae bacterium]|nr:ABC transporter ATP-binding protein/permease [Alcaligenaceae bacterium]
MLEQKINQQQTTSDNQTVEAEKKSKLDQGFGVFLTLWPYLWRYRGRMILAIFCMVMAKVALVYTPIFLKKIIDQLGVEATLMVLPVAALVGYGAAKLGSTLFNEMRDLVFARVIQNSVRQVNLTIFQHLFKLSLRFHLERQTGALSRDLDRGSRAITMLVRILVFRILPTLLELFLIMAILLWNYDVWFTVAIAVNVAVYMTFTYVVTSKRMPMRRAMNRLDSSANHTAIDAILNYETVKYFNNEQYEYEQYDAGLAKHTDAMVTNQFTLSILNVGQGLIITLGTVILLWMSAARVVSGDMSVGDIVLITAYLTQLFIPLGMLGMVYSESQYALIDLERILAMLKQPQEITDRPSALSMDKSRPSTIEFKQVDFSYEAERQILHDVSFTVEAGQTVAVVGESGAGKSTLSRLLFRFYDVDSGAVYINNEDIRDYAQDSLREAIGVVPQDTVLFNHTIAHNIAYGRVDASREEVVQAAKSARLHDFISALPEGYDTQVGERGLKLSGGEKQRVAIARTLLKNPPILILDEATSALDTRTEKEIQDALNEVMKDRTTLIIAHRLSTIMHADQIILMRNGRIAEYGTHQELLGQGGLYTKMWEVQFSDEEEHH